MNAVIAPPRLLVIDDDPVVREIVAAYLSAEGIAVVQAGNAMVARALFRATPIDLALVDVNLPDASGFDLVADLRRTRDCAIIYLTDMGRSEDRIRGLDSGDDYVVKPLEVRELLARIRAVLRRYARPVERVVDTVVELSGWTLDLVRRELADPDGRLVKLTRAEFDLFAALVQSRGVPLARDYLVEVVASADAVTQPRAIDVMVSRIRRKLAQAPQPAPQILTTPGQGYRFEGLGG